MTISLDWIETPERVVAGDPWPVSLRLSNGLYYAIQAPDPYNTPPFTFIVTQTDETFVASFSLEDPPGGMMAPPPPPERVWHIAENGETTGPFARADLGRMVGSGGFTRETLVWSPGYAGWTAAGEVTELAQLFTIAPPPPPPPA